MLPSPASAAHPTPEVPLNDYGDWNLSNQTRSASRGGLKIQWLLPTAQILLDALCWSGLYTALSVLFGRFNNYGVAETVIPTLVMISTLALVGGYNPRGRMASLQYATEHIIACICGMFVSAVAVYLLATFSAGINSSRAIFLLTAGGFCVLSLAHRRFAWFALSRFQPKRSLLVIGDQERAQTFYRAYHAHGQTQELEFLATTRDLIGRTVDGDGTPTFEAGTEELSSRLHAHPENIHEGIVIAADGTKLDPQILNMLATVHFQDMPVYSVQAFYEAYWEKMPAHLITPTWPLQAGFHLVKHSGFATAKRCVDMVASLFALVVLTPLLALVAVAVRLDSSGPVFFRQTRVGQHRTLFTLYKFRTMAVGSDKQGLYTTQNDPRVTRLGRLLRASRLDELPQLFNVLCGDMSLIGPRAEWIKCVETYENIIPHYHFRHLVRPGITGWAQVNYPYGASVEDTVEKLMYDLYYIRNFSLTLDASVILKTIHVMLFGKGR